jgi:uncharacterized protein (DUF488 family)
LKFAIFPRLALLQITNYQLQITNLATLFTIGHSTRSLDELIEALRAHGVERLVDIRSFPRSRKWPQFNRDNLERELPNVGIEYLWMKALGGRRKKIRKDSPNRGLRSEGFRNYADYMLGAEFQQAAAELVRLAEEKPAAYMCAERVYFRCHRMLVSDYLTAQGHTVLHIDATGPARAHKLMDAARVADGKLIYDHGELF